MKHKSLLMPLLLILITPIAVPVLADVMIGGGVGAVLHEEGGPDLSSTGDLWSVFLEYRSESNVGARLELSWLDFPNNAAGFPKAPPASYGQYPPIVKPDIRLSGGSVRLLWFHGEDDWIDPYGSFSVGGFKISQEEFTQIVLLLGPGFGVRFGSGRPSIGFEVGMQMAVFEVATKFLVPIKAYAAIGL